VAGGRGHLGVAVSRGEMEPPLHASRNQIEPTRTAGDVDGPLFAPSDQTGDDDHHHHGNRGRRGEHAPPPEVGPQQAPASVDLRPDPGHGECLGVVVPHSVGLEGCLLKWPPAPAIGG